MSTTEHTHQQDLERLKLFRYMDDDFMTACLEDNYEAVELILRIVLGQEGYYNQIDSGAGFHEKFARAFCYFRCSCS